MSDLPKYPEFIVITDISTASSRVKVGQMYQIEFWATDKDQIETTFFLKDKNGVSHSLNKRIFEFRPLEIEENVLS